MKRLALVMAGVLLGCAPQMVGAPVAPAVLPADDGAAVSELSRAEDVALSWLAAADPRLARRTGLTASAAQLDRLGTDAVLAEDLTLRRSGSALDLFSFRARRQALAAAGEAVKSVARSPMPEVGPPGSGVARPALERELLGRLVNEETARAEDEAHLRESASELVQAVVETWTIPAAPQEVAERDAWLAKKLLEVRDAARARAGATSDPGDLDRALYPLERLLAPTVYPRGAAAIAQLRMALDEDRRPRGQVPDAARVAELVRVHLGVTIDVSSLPRRLDALTRRLAEAVAPRLAGLPAEARAQTLEKARGLYFVERPCGPVRDSRVRSLPPPPERAAVCGALEALAGEATALAALVALHDEVLFARAALEASPPSRSGLSTDPSAEQVEELRTRARERPAFALGPVLAAEILLEEGDLPARLARWVALGEVPLDVAAREIEARPRTP